MWDTMGGWKIENHFENCVPTLGIFVDFRAHRGERLDFKRFSPDFRTQYVAHIAHSRSTPVESHSRDIYPSKNHSIIGHPYHAYLDDHTQYITPQHHNTHSRRVWRLPALLPQLARALLVRVANAAPLLALFLDRRLAGATVLGVHGGCIETCLDEVTAEVTKSKAVSAGHDGKEPKIEFKISRPVQPGVSRVSRTASKRPSRRKLWRASRIKL